MKAIKIDVEKRELYYVDVISNRNSQVDSMHEHLGCDCFCVALRLSDNDLLYVDDEGLFRKQKDINGVFAIKGQPQPLVGHGLICGHDEAGEAIDVKITIERIKPHIVWLLPDAVSGYLL